MAKKVFVTVGSTSFDELISAVSDEKCLEALASKGYTNLTLQIGRGTHLPTKNSLIDIDYYDYKEDITEDINSSSLVISHAGAGSILLSLENERPLIVVINNQLMNNHQEELAKELGNKNYLKYCYPNQLADAIKNFNGAELMTYISPYPGKFQNFFDRVMGYD